jgi:hypothetical protein
MCYVCYSMNAFLDSLPILFPCVYMFIKHSYYVPLLIVISVPVRSTHVSLTAYICGSLGARQALLAAREADDLRPP